MIEFIWSSNRLQILQANVDTLVLFAGSIFTSSYASPLHLINKEFFQLSAVATDVHLVEDFLLLSSFSVETVALGGVPSKKKQWFFVALEECLCSPSPCLQ